MKGRLTLATAAVAFVALLVNVGLYLRPDEQQPPPGVGPPDRLGLELGELHREKAPINEALAVRLRQAEEDGDGEEVRRVEAEADAVTREYKRRADAIYRKHGRTPPRAR